LRSFADITSAGSNASTMPAIRVGRWETSKAVMGLTTIEEVYSAVLVDAPRT